MSWSPHRTHPRARAAIHAGLARLTIAALVGGALLSVTATTASAAEDPGLYRPVSDVIRSVTEVAEQAGELAARRRAEEAARAEQRRAAEAARDPWPEHCRDAGAGDVPTVLAEIFRCRLTRAGLPPEHVSLVTAEALVVSRCESRWDPHVVVFDGRYTEHAHPATGYRYTAAGVFQFIRRTGDDWVDGGYTWVKDARRNIDAAARLYLHNRANGFHGWEDWACAAANDGFRHRSVLPGWPGGPEALPGWAWEY